MQRARDLPKYLLPAFGILALWVACGSEVEDDRRTATVPEIEEIPVTTGSPEALTAFEAGRRALDVGRNQQANELFRAAVGQDPEFALAYLGIADSAASAAEFKNSLDLARRHVEGKSAGERLLVDIYQTFFANDAERRIELAERLVDSYPRSPRAWLRLGFMKGGLNHSEAARKAFGKALELAPDLLAAHYALWGSYLFSEPKSFERALQAMERCIEIEPDEAKCHESLGDVYRAMNDLDKARELYARATELDSELAVAQLKKGHIESFLGNFEAARKAYDAGVERATGANRPIYANYRAFTHLHRDDPGAALDELGGIADSAGGFGLSEDQVSGVLEITYENMATIALHHQLFAEAERILAKSAAVRRAEAEKLGDADYTRLQEAGILFWEGQLAARRGDLVAAEAEAAAHRALLENDDNPRRFERYHGLRGLIELCRGDFGQAIEHFQQSNLTMVYVKYHLALAYAGAGDQHRARKLFREVGEWNFNTVGYALVRRDALRRAAE